MTQHDFNIRVATEEDIPFLVDTIIEAEKSGTATLTYSTIFGLSEEDARKYIEDMLREEIDGCELSISAFLLAENDGRIAGAVGAWVEGLDGVPSSMLKGNLLSYTLPKSCIEKASALNNLVKELHIEYKDNTVQIGLVYVAAAFRGQGLVNILIEEQLTRLNKLAPDITESYVQVFGNNKAAIRSYEKSGYAIILEKISTVVRMCEYFPSASKVLMKRDLK
jgi:ribosomal protein S18 acetylase RimI-like enzyme